MRLLAARLLIWLLAEVCLTVLEMDDLADYGEYVFQARPVSSEVRLISFH